MTSYVHTLYEPDRHWIANLASAIAQRTRSYTLLSSARGRKSRQASMLHRPATHLICSRDTKAAYSCFRQRPQGVSVGSTKVLAVAVFSRATCITTTALSLLLLQRIDSLQAFAASTVAVQWNEAAYASCAALLPVEWKRSMTGTSALQQRQRQNVESCTRTLPRIEQTCSCFDSSVEIGDIQQWRKLL